MNRNLLVTALVATAAFGASFAASAQTNAASTTQRDVNQEQRINNGVRDGSLTNRQAAKLERGQSHVDAREARAGADGHIGANEQRRIQRADNRQSKRIYNKRHDGVVKG